MRVFHVARLLRLDDVNVSDNTARYVSMDAAVGGRGGLDVSSLPRRPTFAGRRPPGAAIRALPDAVGGARIELRQLRYFVTLAEELHFGRAAAREHIVPSALSAQVQRLERAVGVLLVD